MKTARISIVAILAVLFLAVLGVPGAGYAEESVLTTQGVVGDMDAGKRDPVLSVGKNVTTGLVKLTAVAVVPNHEYTKYPIRYEFYVNGRLVLTQFSSPELPVTAGLDIVPNIASIPLNYAVVACLIHPNHNYCTVVMGAATEADMTPVTPVVTTITCTLSATDPTDGSVLVYTAADITSTKQADGTYPLSFTGSTSDGLDEAVVSGAVTVTGSTAASTLNIDYGDGPGDTATTGTAAVQDTSLSALDLSSSDGATKLSCK